jgi:hypothetical protein
MVIQPEADTIPEIVYYSIVWLDSEQEALTLDDVTEVPHV